MELRSFSAGTVERIGNVMKITYLKNAVITLEDQLEITKIREELFGNNEYVTLIDLRDDNVEFTTEAKQYVTNNKVIKKLRIAEVLLVKSFTQKIGIHAYVRIFRSKDNVTVMTNEENALHWLNKQYKKHADKVPVEN